MPNFSLLFGSEDGEIRETGGEIRETGGEIRLFPVFSVVLEFWLGLREGGPIFVGDLNFRTGLKNNEIENGIDCLLVNTERSKRTGLMKDIMLLMFCRNIVIGLG